MSTLSTDFHPHIYTQIRSGRRKKRSKDKLNAVVVPSLDSEDAAGELVDGGDGDSDGDSDGEGFDGLDMAVAAAVDSDISLPMDAGLEIETAASD